MSACHEKIKISGFTLIRNGIRFEYPFLESLRSLLPLVDELIINVGISDDHTLEWIKKFVLEEGEGKARFFETDWPLKKSEKNKNGLILAEQTNLALEQCTGDWCLYLQADEVLHEADYSLIKESIKLANPHLEIDGLLFNYIHFYGSYGIFQQSRSSYRREVRAIRRSSQIESVGDAQSFRKKTGSKLKAVSSDARVFHYGWVRPPEAMREKTYFMDELYHGPSKPENKAAFIPHSGDNYRYKRISGLKKFKASHPKVMTQKIQEKKWNWSPDHQPLAWTWKDLIKFSLDFFEKLTGHRLFEYKNYHLVPLPLKSISSSKPVATLILATYEMPKHLELVLAGIERQSTKNFEIIICDDGSGAETKILIEKFKKVSPVPVTHLWQEHQGFRKCRILNQAIRNSQGNVLIFLDGDCIPHRHFIADHLNHQADGYYLAGRRMDLGPHLSHLLTPQKIRIGFFDFPRFSLIQSVLKKETTHLNRSIRVPWNWLRTLLRMNRIVDLKGCNFSVSKTAMESINGFDEEYEGYGREDTDVELRLKNNGLKIKSLKGLALQFHVWHPRREFTVANDKRLEEVEITKRIRCARGLSPTADPVIDKS